MVRIARDTDSGLAVVRDHRTVSYTHLRAHETVLDLVCRLLLEKKKQTIAHEAEHARTHKHTYGSMFTRGSKM